jgi:uncharacterized membrane protein
MKKVTMILAMILMIVGLTAQTYSKVTRAEEENTGEVIIQSDVKPVSLIKYVLGTNVSYVLKITAEGNTFLHACTSITVNYSGNVVTTYAGVNYKSNKKKNTLFVYTLLVPVDLKDIQSNKLLGFKFADVNVVLTDKEQETFAKKAELVIKTN